VGIHGRVDIERHGRVVAVVLSPRALIAKGAAVDSEHPTHMIPPSLARSARIERALGDFDDG